jgi:hypothetical protein
MKNGRDRQMVLTFYAEESAKEQYHPTDKQITTVRERMRSAREMLMFHAEFDEGDERLSLQKALEDFLVLAHAGVYGLCWTLDSANTVLRYWFAGDPSFVGESLDEVDYSVARELEIEKFYKEDSSEGVSDERRNEVYELAEAEIGCKDDL